MLRTWDLEQQVYAQLDRRQQTSALSLLTAMCSRSFFGSRSTAEDSLDKLRALELTSVLPEGLSKYQSDFLDLSASVSSEVLSGRARCMLIEAQLPDAVRIGLALMVAQGGEAYTEPSKLFDYARQTMAQLPEICQKWFGQPQKQPVAQPSVQASPPSQLARQDC